MPGGGVPSGRGMPGGGLPGGDGQMPQPPDGASGELPGELPGGAPGRGGGGGFPGGFGRSNILAERFHANADFEARYEAELTRLRAELYGGDVADAIVDRWVSTLTAGAADLVSSETITEEAASIRSRFTTG